MRICSQIANSGSTSNKDRIEARKAVDLANAHIFRLVSEGTMFHHLPEVSKYVKVLQGNDNHPELPNQPTDSISDVDSSSNTVSIDSSSNIDNINNNNKDNNNILTSSRFDSDSSHLDSDDAE